MAKLKVKDYESYNQFLVLAQSQLDILERGSTELEVKPLEFRDAIFGVLKFFIEDATKGNNPPSNFSLDEIKSIGSEISRKLEELYCSNPETNTRTFIQRASRYQAVAHRIGIDPQTVLNTCHMITSYPEANRTLIQGALRKSYYGVHESFGSEDMYVMTRNFLEVCANYKKESHRYLLTPDYILTDMLKVGVDLRQLAEAVQPLTVIESIVEVRSCTEFESTFEIKLPYKNYYDIIVAMIPHRASLDAVLISKAKSGIEGKLVSFSKYKFPITSVNSLMYLDDIPEGLRTLFKLEESSEPKGKLDLNSLYLERYSDSVRHSIYDYFTDESKSEEVCSVITIPTLETHVYRGVSEEDFTNYIGSLRNYCCIKEIEVKEKFRGQGLLRQMLDKLIAEAKAQGVAKIILQPYPLNPIMKTPEAIALLQKRPSRKVYTLGI